MHIVFLTNEFPKKDLSHGGIGTFIKFLAQKLVDNNFKISVLGINNLFHDEFSNEDGIDIYRLKKSNWKLVKFIDYSLRIQKKITQINNKCTIDIIEGSELNFAFFPKTTTYKKVIRLHGGHHFFSGELGVKTSFWRSFQEKRSFLKADSFVAVSNYVGYKTREYLKIKFNYITIYNSIKLDAFYKANINKEISKRLVFIGTICEKKGIYQLLEAFKTIKKKHPDLTLEVVGRDWKSNKIESYINYLKVNFSDIINKGITFHGAIPPKEIPKIIETAEICVYPSLAESFGLTIIEAMSMGKAVAASNIEPFKEIVENSNSVSFFNPNSIKSIFDAIDELLQDSLKREKMKLISREHVLKKFNTTKIVEENIKYYNTIFNKS